MQTTTAALIIGLPLCVLTVNTPALAGQLQRAILVDQAQDSLDGSCAVEGQCNLRAALKQAQSMNQETNIVLAVDVMIDQGAIVLMPADAGAVIHIEGREVTKTILGNESSRLFELGTMAHITLRNLSITHFRSYEGGAILNQGVLEMSETNFQKNKAECFGTGAMTAYATCSGGAIVNSGHLILKNGSRFESNEVTAAASTASFTTASAHGGAISSSGMITMEGSTYFVSNKSVSLATSGIHPMPAGGASASSFGGAIAQFNAALLVTDTGSAVFQDNEANAEASTHYGEALKNSRGGALFSSGGSLELSANQFIFQNNKADVDPDLSQD